MAGQYSPALPLEEVVVNLCLLHLSWEGVEVEPCPLHSSWGGAVVNLCPLHSFWEEVGEEYPHNFLVVPCSLTVWGATEYLHLRTAEEGLEGDCQVDSGNWMLHHYWLRESLEG